MHLHGQFLFGVFVSLLTVAFQSLATVAVIRASRRIGRHLSRRHAMRSLIVIMAISGTLLTAAHFIEVGFWALAYAMVSETQLTDTYYLAFVNFTTLGSSIEPDPSWRLLGPMAAANGMLLFGWSTAVLFTALSRTMALMRFR